MNSTGIRLATLALLSIGTPRAALADCSTDSPPTHLFLYPSGRQGERFPYGFRQSEPVMPRDHQ